MFGELGVSAGPPRLVRVRHLVPGEVIVRETRSTRWSLFPGPIFAELLTGLLTYIAAAAVWTGLPAFPGATNAISHLQGFWGLHLYVFAVFALLFVVAGLWLFVRYIRWITTVYAISDHRVLVQRGLFNLALDEIPVAQIRGVDAYQNLWNRLFGYGTVRISSEGGRSIGNEEFVGIPRPFEFQRLIEAMVQDQSPQHSLRGLEEVAAELRSRTPERVGRITMPPG